MNLDGMTSVLDGWATRWRDYRSALASLRELENEPGVAATVAAELGLSVSELKDVVVKGVGAYELMVRMMAAFDLDPEEVRDEAPELMRDVEVMCSLCAAKGRCQRELDAGTAAANARSFCSNAATFEALV